MYRPPNFKTWLRACIIREYFHFKTFVEFQFVYVANKIYDVTSWSMLMQIL